MKFIDFPKRIANLVKNNRVHQTIRTDRWAAVLIGEQLAVYVGMNHGRGDKMYGLPMKDNQCYPAPGVVIPGPGRYVRRIKTITVMGNVSLRMTPTECTVNGHDIADLDAFAYLEGYGDWEQCQSFIFDHCDIPDPGRDPEPPYAELEPVFNGVLLTFV
jgi:hypothetical protein